MQNIIDANFKVIGDVELILCDAEGNVKEKHEVKNLVVASGKYWIASRMVGTASAVMSHMAIGTGSTTPSTGNSALVAEVARVALTGANASTNQVTYSAYFAPGVGTGAIQESGILNAASEGSLLCRTTFATVNKGVLDSLTINWTVTVI